MLLTTANLALKQAHSHLSDLKHLVVQLELSHDDHGVCSERLRELINEEEALEGSHRSRRSFIGSMRSSFASSRMFKTTVDIGVSRMSGMRSTESIGKIDDQSSQSRCKDCIGWNRGKKNYPETKLMAIINGVRSSITISTVLILNALFILIELTRRNDDNYGHAAWLYIEIVFMMFFTLEFVIKLFAWRLGYFRDGWNWFDFIIVGLSWFGLAMELSAYDESGGTNVSKEARIFRLNKVFRVLRILRLVRLMRFFKALALKLQSKDISISLGEHMRTITAFRAFVQAHCQSQVRLAALFADDGKVRTVEEARCILESQTQIYKALHVAAAEADNVEAQSVVFMRMLRDNIKLTRKLSDFVVGAHESGVITMREAETIAHPLQDHVRIFQEGIQRTVRGSLTSVSDISHGGGSMNIADFRWWRFHDDT